VQATQASSSSGLPSSQSSPGSTWPSPHAGAGPVEPEVELPLLASPLLDPSLSLAPLVVVVESGAGPVELASPSLVLAAASEVELSSLVSFGGGAQAASDMAARTGRHAPRGDWRGGAVIALEGVVGEATAAVASALTLSPITPECIERRA
jgi:hypothetical protein